MQCEEEMRMHTFPPVPPYQLLERVHADVVGIHVVNINITLLEIFLLNLIWVPRATSEKQHYHQHRPVGVVWVRGWCIGRRPNRLGFCAI